MLQTCRQNDLACRYGGEEFVILLPDIDQSGAEALAEQVRAEIESLRIPHVDSPVSPWVTISLGGVTQVPPESQDEPELFCIADAALYQAKRQGRNRVIWSIPTEPCIKPVVS